MQVIDVHMICSEILQANVHFLQDICLGSRVGLGGYHDLVPLTLNGSAKDPFTFSVPVVRRCIEIVDAQINATRDDLGFGIVSQAVPDRGDLKPCIAQGSVDNFSRRLRKRI